MAGSNESGGWGFDISGSGLSPAQALFQGAAMNDRRSERDAEMQYRLGKQKQEDVLGNLKYSEGIGKNFKSLPERVQNFSDKQLEDFQKEFQSPEYLSLPPAAYQALIQQKLTPFVAWHQRAENAANTFEKNFSDWATEHKAVPTPEAHEWVRNQFANDFLDQDDKGNVTFKPPSLLKERDYIKDLSDPNVIGQFNVDMSSLPKTITGLPTNPIGDRQYVSKNGRVHSFQWKGVGTNFSNPVEDESGNIKGLELVHDTVPGTDIKIATPAFKDAILNSTDARDSYAKMRAITKQHLQDLGKPFDDKTLNYMTDNALYQFASPFVPHDVVRSETEKTPVTKITVNNGGKNSDVNINDIHSEIDHKTQFKLNGEPRENRALGKPAVPFNELSTTAQGLVLKQARDITNDNNLNQDNLFIEKQDDGELYIIKHEKDKNTPIAPLSFRDVNLPLNKTQKEKQRVLQESNQSVQPIRSKKKIAGF